MATPRDWNCRSLRFRKSRLDRDNAFDPVPAGDSIELKFIVEFCRIVEAAEARATSSDAPILEPLSTESEQAIDELFAENRVWSIPAIEGEPRPSLSRSR